MKPKKYLDAVYRRVNGATGGALDILRDAFDHFGESKAPHVAAGLAYYSMFSLFPMLLALIAVGSFFLEGELVQQQVVTSVTRVVPISEQLILDNVDQVLDRRGRVGGVGLLGLLWAGTGVFTVLVNHINRAWVDAESRGLLEQRILGLSIGLIGVLAAVLMLLLLTTPVLNVLPRLQLAPGVEIRIFDTPLWSLIATTLPGLVIFLIFLSLYRWVPNTDVCWSEAVWGAAFVALAWGAAKRGFAWYVSSDLVEYRLVYGSLGAVVALLLWIYLTSWLVLFGAHLSAAVARHRRRVPSQDQKPGRRTEQEEVYHVRSG
jgi:membrane protein